MEETPSAPSDGITREVTLEVFWGDADAVEPVFADNLALQRVNEQFYLTFGQIRLPATSAVTDRTVAEIRPVARLIIPKDALHRVAELLTRNLPDRG